MGYLSWKLCISSKKQKWHFWIFVIVVALVLIFGGLLIYWKINQKPPETAIAVLSKDKPKSETAVDPKILDFGLKIEKIAVLAPVIKNVDGTKKSTYNKALESGVAHYKGTALPGKNSNIFIFGHSSTIFGKGQYSEIFAHLNDLQKGDSIVIYYQNKEYKYEVSAKKIVANSETSVLRPTKQEQLTLMTCWPVGTNAKRLIIIAYKV